jgi:nucleotide-binding universal stress UspA family protein
VVRTTKVPVLVSRNEHPEIKRVLVSVDRSYATGPTIAAARRFTQLFRAQLKVVHVVEPLPLIAALPIALDQDAYYRLSETQFNETIGVHLQGVEVERVMLRGAADDCLVEEAAKWGADLLVVGSHGKGWVDRLLVGSTTERLLNHLPASTLVVPVAAPRSDT